MISAADARAARRGRDRDGERDIDARDRDIQQLARTDLLNLHLDFDYWNPPQPPASEPGDASPRPGALQQRGIIRRRARAGYLELTDDARFSLTPESAPDAH